MPEIWLPPRFDAAEWRITVDGRRWNSTHHLDALLTALADAQHGLVGLAQLRVLGVPEGRVRARLASGHLHRVRPGVYAVARRQLSPAARRMAAVLAAGADARLAGWSAASQRGLLPEAGRRIDLAIPPSRRIALPGVQIRRIASRRGDVEVVDGIPTHAVARLLLDIAVRNDEATLEWAWRQAIFRDVLDVRAVARVLDEHAGRPGTPALRALYDRRRRLVGALRNEFELLMLSIIREAGLPEPLCNRPFAVAPGMVLHPDFRIPELQLIIEGDGRDGHADVEFLFTDEERDAFYAARRYGTLRYGYWEAKRERGRVVAELRAWRPRRAQRG